MKLVRLLIVLAIATLSLAACGGDDSNSDAAGVAANSAEGGTGNPLLAFVPADTPYVGGNLAPVPDDIIDAYLKRFEPAIANLQTEFSKARVELESDPEQLASDSELRIAHALLVELDGKLSRSGLESLGLDLSSYQVVYGISAFPVMRYALSDAVTLRATVQRVLDNAKVEAPELEFQGQKYWRFTPDVEVSSDDFYEEEYAEEEYDEEMTDDASDVDGVEDSDPENDDGKEVELSIYLAILPDHLVIGMLPPFAESSLLPAFLALEKPSNSSAESILRDINKKYGYSAYGTGTVDFQKLANEFTNPQSLIGQLLTQAGEDMSKFSTDLCRQEISSMIARTPRAVTGITELNANSVGSQGVIEIESTLATEMIALVSDVPHVNPKSTYLAELAVGLKVGAVRDFLRSKAMAIVEAPYQCEALADMNTRAQEAADQLNQPIPPMVNNLLGLRAAISSVGSEMMSADAATGMVALHVTQPEMLIGMAQMLLPGLAELNLAVGEPPVQVPAEMLPMPNAVLYAAQSKSAIGLSVGEGEQNSLIDFINKEGKAKGVFLSANYDAAAFQEMTGGMGGDDFDDGENDTAGDVAEKFQQAYKEMAGRNDVRLSLSKDGFVFDSSTTFKNP